MNKQSYNNKINLLAEKLTGSAAIVIGAASGMSASAGFRHYYERDKTFLEYFGEFEKITVIIIHLMDFITDTVQVKKDGHLLQGSLAASWTFPQDSSIMSCMNCLPIKTTTFLPQTKIHSLDGFSRPKRSVRYKATGGISNAVTGAMINCILLLK